MEEPDYAAIICFLEDNMESFADYCNGDLDAACHEINLLRRKAGMQQVDYDKP